MAAWILLVSFVKVRLSESVVKGILVKKKSKSFQKYSKWEFVLSNHFTVGSIDLAYLLLSLTK